MIKRLLFLFFIAFYSLGKAQCPQIYDGNGILQTNPRFVFCSAGDYLLNFSSPTGWGAYTIDWGDGTTPTAAGAYVQNTIVQHTYTATVNTFTITLSIPSLGCTKTMLVVLERPVNASIQIPIGGVTQVCAPKTLTFTNSSTNVSSTTSFTWNFGDGTGDIVFPASNVGQNVTHNYQKNTVNCQTQVTLRATNYCQLNTPSVANYNPIQIYDVDIDVAITPDRAVRCWPDNTFSLLNTTQRNCVPEGNTFQRQEKWNLGNYWGYGHDSIIDWRPWPPTSPLIVAYPSVGTYTVLLLDSNLCGISRIVQSVSIVNPPTAGMIAPSGNLCQSTNLTFTNTSATGYAYVWDFGTGSGFQNVGSGNPVRSFPNPGTFTVKVVAFIPGSGSACSDTAKAVITILASPVSNFTATPVAGCSSLTNVTFTDLSTGVSGWNWRFGNGNTSTLQVPPTQAYLTTGAFTASLIVTGTTSCVNTKTISIIVRPKPVPNFPVIAPCVGAAGTFTSTSTITGTNAITGYTWSFGDSTPNATNSQPTHTYTSAGNYTVKLITATAFCTDSVSKVISVNVKPTADFAFTPTINCPPFVSTFTNNSANATNYLWRFGTAATATTTAANPTFTYNNATQNFLNYTVTLIASTGLGCADSIKKPLRVRPKPVAQFTVTNNGGCSPLTTTFTNSTIGATTYSWSFGDGTSSVTANPPHTYSNVSVLLQTNTITLIATNSVSCTDTIQHTIQIFPQPLTTFTMLPGSGCTPLTVNFPSVPGVVSYTWNFGDQSPVIIASTPTVHVFTNTTNANKTYTVKLIASNAFGCVDSSFKFPLIYPTPIPNFAQSPTVGCSALITTLSNTSTLADTYLWKFGDGVTSTATNTTHTYTNTSNTTDQTFTCTLIAFSNDGCKDSLKKNVLVYYKPLASFIHNNPGCLSPTINFTNTTTGGATSSWNFGDGTNLSALVNPSHTFTNNTINNVTQTVQLTVTTAHSCTDVAVGNPVIFSHPVASFAMLPTVGCSPLSNTMTNASLYAHTYKWKFGDGAISTATNTTHTYTNTSNTVNQTFTCTLIAYNNNGCEDSLKNNVIVYFKPAASFLVNAPGCVSSNFSFTNTTVGTSTNNWNFGDGVFSTLVNPAHTYTNNTLNNITHTVELLVTTVNSCTDIARAFPVAFSHPVANFVMTPTIGCSPLSSNMINTSTLAHNYLWKYGDGSTVTTTNTSHTYTNTSNVANQNFTCTLVAYNNNGCRDSLMKNVLVLFKPKATFTLNDPKCTSQTITFTNTSLGAAVNTWTFGDGSPVSTSTNPTHNYTNTTLSNITYSVMLVVSTVSLCTDTAYASPEIYAKPVSVFTMAPTTGCSPMLASFTNSSSAAHTYKWKFGDGAASTQLNTSHTYSNSSHTTNQDLTAELVAYNNNGCRDSMHVPILLYYKPKAAFGLDTPACTPKVISFTNTSVGASDYSWKFGDGGTSTATNTTHEYINNTSFNQLANVSLIATSPNGCKDTLIVPVFVHPKPTFFIAAQPDSGCSPLTVFFPKIGGVTYYQWYYDNNIGFGNTGDISNTFLNTTGTSKTYDVKLVAKDIFGCSDTPSIAVKVFPKPVARFSANPLSVYIPNQATRITNLSNSAASYTYTFGDGGESNDPEPSHTYVAAGEFQIVLMVTSNGGCVDTFALDQKVIALDESSVLIPNAFTPSPSGSPGPVYSDVTDKKNEVFHPLVKGADKYQLSIYSRWGELLFDTKDPLEGWDGYYKGQICTQDVYIWKVVAVFLDGKVYNKTGDVLLLR